MRRTILLGMLACVAAFYACDDLARSYPTCPPGVSPDEFDCIPPTSIDEDVGGADAGPVELDTSVTVDASPGDASVTDVCVPDCSGRECGSDGCGGVCGTCNRGEACSAGECVPRMTPGEIDCAGIIECVEECRTEECWEGCIAQGDPVAQEEFYEILICLEEECSRFQDDPDRYAQCQEEECGEEIWTCFGGGEGTLTCSESLECMSGCRTDECRQECYFGATSTGQRQLEELFSCAGRRCSEVGGREWMGCVEESCPDIYAECFEVEPPPDPEGGCSRRDWARLDGLGEEIAIFILECGFSCEGSGDPDDCAAECVESQIGTSASCSGCLGELSVCVAGECGEICLDPFSPECEDCAEDRCTESFDECAGGF